eukprot:TRINITY_DN13805_c1_g1_i1.p1 TRINITY_DN13805_c1_g1~~TRINITY_DN13805_c1_g1_i1.p1  ORF type:complete len:110 (+),score=1.71 TRINITY_DN13805_c1_g1_i1:1752-2081(+)
MKPKLSWTFRTFLCNARGFCNAVKTSSFFACVNFLRFDAALTCAETGKFFELIFLGSVDHFLWRGLTSLSVLARKQIFMECGSQHYANVPLFNEFQLFVRCSNCLVRFQ